MTYFSSFPQLIYSNTVCVDLTRRVKLSEDTKNALSLYYVYEIADGLRADIIADAYYEEPTMDWLLWLSNDIVDPYYQWNLNEQEFNNFLIQKYGSVENSIKKIVYYRNNWYDDDKVLTPDFYDNIIPNNWKKYYVPFYGPNTKILYWKRREEDWVMETNKIYKLTCNSAPFVAGELVDVSNGAIRVGGGEVVDKDDAFILIKNVDIDGAMVPNNVVTGETSNVAQTISEVDLVYEAIGTDEGVFWSPVNYFDIENEKNAYNRSIKILDRAYIMPTLEQIRSRLNE
jgi:hypothetical protein